MGVVGPVSANLVNAAADLAEAHDELRKIMPNLVSVRRSEDGKLEAVVGSGATPDEIAAGQDLMAEIQGRVAAGPVGTVPAGVEHALVVLAFEPDNAVARAALRAAYDQIRGQQ
jgi:hypothetical protein